MEIEKLGINTLTHIEKEDIIKYNDEQGLLLYSLCPACFEENYLKEPEVRVAVKLRENPEPVNIGIS